MKVYSVFSHIFATFAFLTLGSLMLIVSAHILTLDDAIMKLRELYSNPWRSFQTASMGLFFIAMGLGFARILVKRGRESEALIIPSDHGPILVSVLAIEDVAKKVLKRFYLVKDAKVKTVIHGKNVEIKIRLILWSSGKVQELLQGIQEEISHRVRKLLHQESRVEITCDVLRIEDHEGNVVKVEDGHAVSF